MPPHADERNHDDELGFSSSLLAHLAGSRDQLNEFVDRQKTRADAAHKTNAVTVSSEQDEIEALYQRLKAIQAERGLLQASSSSSSAAAAAGMARRRAELQETQLERETELTELKRLHAEKQQELDEIMNEEAAQRARAEKARHQKEEVEEMKQTTVDDLTKGIVNYKHLGLDFEKAARGSLRFTFTLLDREMPSRPFVFSLNVTEELYEVEECTPPLDPHTVQELVDQLNSTEPAEFSPFIRGMRKYFSNGLPSYMTRSVSFA
eukprot:scaffold17391_cov54-Attheya_sp.AAC.5